MRRLVSDKYRDEGIVRILRYLSLGPLEDRVGRFGDWTYWNTNGQGLLDYMYMVRRTKEKEKSYGPYVILTFFFLLLLVRRYEHDSHPRRVRRLQSRQVERG